MTDKEPTLEAMEVAQKYIAAWFPRPLATREAAAIDLAESFDAFAGRARAEVANRAADLVATEAGGLLKYSELVTEIRKLGHATPVHEGADPRPVERHIAVAIRDQFINDHGLRDEFLAVLADPNYKVR